MQENLAFNFENPEHELFMFSILLGRFDMALVFWKEGKVKANNYCLMS